MASFPHERRTSNEDLSTHASRPSRRRGSGVVSYCTLFPRPAMSCVPLLDQVERKTYDMRLRALEREAPRFVTIAAIDEASLARLGRWPWSRTTLASWPSGWTGWRARHRLRRVFSERESPRRWPVRARDQREPQGGAGHGVRRSPRDAPSRPGRPRGRAPRDCAAGLARCSGRGRVADAPGARRAGEHRRAAGRRALHRAYQHGARCGRRHPPCAARDAFRSALLPGVRRAGGARLPGERHAGPRCCVLRHRRHPARRALYPARRGRPCWSITASPASFPGCRWWTFSKAAPIRR